MPEQKSTPNILLNSKILVGIVAAVLFVLGLILVAQGFIDTRNYREQIISIIKERTGRDATIKGAVTVSLLPLPTLFIPGLEIREPESETPSASPAPAMAVDLIRIRVPLFSVFSETPSVSAVILEKPVLELVRPEKGTINWDWLNSSLLESLTQNRDTGALQVEIHSGKVLYTDDSADTVTTVSNINAYAINDERQDFGGSLTLYGHTLSFSGFTGPQAGGGNAGMPFEFALSSTEEGEHSANLQGTLSFKNDLPVIQGKLEVAVANALTWMKANTQQEEKLLQQVTNTFRQEKPEAAPAPLKFSGNWLQEGASLALSDLQFEGMNSQGQGSIRLAWPDWNPDIAVDMNFSNFNFDHWRTFIVAAFSGDESEMSRIYRRESQDDNPLPRDSTVVLRIGADKMQVGPQTWDDVRLFAEMSEGAITVNQFDINLPGESTLTLFGLVSQAATHGLRFEGSMETQGKSLRNFLTIFDAAAANLPETGFEEFFARSNIFVSAEQLRLSEADVKLSDLHLNGGLVAYFDANPRLEADVKLNDISFDYFRDAWRQKQRETGVQEDFFFKLDKSTDFNWLKRLATTIDFRIKVDKFTFLEKDGTLASFRLYARRGDIGIYDINFVYPTDSIKGSVKLDVNGEQPFVTAALNISEFNTDYFSRENKAAETEENAAPPESPDPPPSSEAQEQTPSSPPPAAEEAPEALERPAAGESERLELEAQSNLLLAQAEEALPPRPATTLDDLFRQEAEPSETSRKRWSEELLDMTWMNGIGGSFDLTIGKLVHNDITLRDLEFEGKLEGGLINFKKFTFNYWGGECSILGSMYGGKVPGMAISFTIVDAQLYDILHDLTDRENITGKISISATLSTSGVNFLSWVSQAEGKIVMIARGVLVSGINLQGVVDAVTISRTASDVFNNVNLALVNGSTIFSVEGNINVKNGMMRTPGINLKADTILGNLSGEVRMVPWTMDLSALFQFPSMSSETVPTMTVQVSGPLGGGELRTDTSSLEAYVAKRIISK